MKCANYATCGNDPFFVTNGLCAECLDSAATGVTKEKPPKKTYGEAVCICGAPFTKMTWNQVHHSRECGIDTNIKTYNAKQKVKAEKKRRDEFDEWALTHI